MINICSLRKKMILCAYHTQLRIFFTICLPFITFILILIVTTFLSFLINILCVFLNLSFVYNWKMTLITWQPAQSCALNLSLILYISDLLGRWSTQALFMLSKVSFLFFRSLSLSLYTRTHTHTHTRILVSISLVTLAELLSCYIVSDRKKKKKLTEQKKVWHGDGKKEKEKL